MKLAVAITTHEPEGPEGRYLDAIAQVEAVGAEGGGGRRLPSLIGLLVGRGIVRDPPAQGLAQVKAQRGRDAVAIHDGLRAVVSAADGQWAMVQPGTRWRGIHRRSYR